jgi:hypothetical protein
MFASNGVGEHLARGLVGLGALAASTFWAASHPWLALAALPVAVIALRGCPMCWTVGLVQTVVARIRGKTSPGACVDGTCALAPAATPRPPSSV